MLRCQFLCHVLKALFFITIALKLSYLCKKMQNFRALFCKKNANAKCKTAPPLRISGYAPVSAYLLYLHGGPKVRIIAISAIFAKTFLD